MTPAQVRAQIARLHRRSWSSRELIVADFAALAVAIAAVAIDPTVAPGAVAVAGVVTIHRITARAPVPAKVIGIRQTILGLAVVLEDPQDLLGRLPGAVDHLGVTGAGSAVDVDARVPQVGGPLLRC